MNEIELLNRVIKRMEEELHAQATESAVLKAENTTLRSVLGGDNVLVAMEKAKRELEAYATREHEKTRAAILRVRREEEGR